MENFWTGLVLGLWVGFALTATAVENWLSVARVKDLLAKAEARAAAKAAYKARMKDEAK